LRRALHGRYRLPLKGTPYKRKERGEEKGRRETCVQIKENAYLTMQWLKCRPDGISLKNLWYQQDGTLATAKLYCVQTVVQFYIYGTIQTAPYLERL